MEGEGINMERVLVTRPICGICHMQVCAVVDATDEEILEVCNGENPAGTTNGWGDVCREGHFVEWMGVDLSPVPFDDHEGRRHFMVGC